MPRKGNVSKRDVLPDPIYNSKLVTRLINKLMYDGKKGTAQTILYSAFEIIEKKTEKLDSGTVGGKVRRFKQDYFKVGNRKMYA